MAITDISISEELMTNAPSIKYRGNEGPKSPQEMQQKAEYDKQEYIIEFENVFPEMKELRGTEEYMEMLEDYFRGLAGGQPLPQDPTKPVNPFQPKPTGPVLPDRQMAAYGGIMGLDGRKQYGFGSFFQKYIKDPIEVAFTDKTFQDLEDESQARVDAENKKYGKNYENPLDTLFKGGREDPDDPNTKRDDTGLNKYIIPAIGGAVAGLFTKKNEDGTTSAASPDETALQLANLKKSANVLGQKEGLAANLNFLPAESASNSSPSEMLEAYQNAANGGRIGYQNAGPVLDEQTTQMILDMHGRGMDIDTIQTITQQDPNSINAIINSQNLPRQMPKEMAEGGIMDLGGMEKDYRAEGGFVPIGREEKADDVPARLSVNEFVFTADAVRNAGGGDIDQGAQVMENMMKHLEQGGQVSEESQGMQGARDMFETSERLSEVI